MAYDGNGNGAYQGMPWWVRAVGVVGGPMAIALIMLYLYAGSLADTRKAAEAAVTESRGSLTALRDHQEATLRIMTLLEKICARLGHNDYEREACR